MSNKPLAKPAWYKNTYFWISGILLILGIVGMPALAGAAAIRDPGQKRENYLYLLYIGSAVVMLINGFISHSQTVQHYREETETAADSEAETEKNKSE